MVYKSATLGALMLVLLQLANGTSNFLAISPSNVAPYSEFTVAIVNLADDVPANVTLTLQDSSNNLKPFLTQKIVPLAGGQSDLVNLWIGNVPLGEYELMVSTNYDNDEVVTVRRTSEQYHPKVMIQTDRPAYTPGSVVKFRILTLDQGLRPMQIREDFSVELLDSAKNIIKVWKEAGLEYGVFQARIQLADSPNLGDWAIQVSVNDRVTMRLFKVLHEAVPIYDVEIKSGKITTQWDQDLALEVKARYYFGRPMNGRLRLTLDGGKQLEHSMQIVNGHGSMLFPLASLLESTAHSAIKYIAVNGTFTVTSDGDKPWDYPIRVNIPVYPTPYKIDVRMSTTRFVPGKPYTFSVAISDPLGATVQQNWKPLLIRTHEKSPKILEQPLSTVGTASVTFGTSPSSSKVFVEVKYLNISRGFELTSVSASDGDNFRRLELSILTHEPSISSPLAIAVFANFPLDTLVYTVSSFGTIYSVQKHHVNNVNYVELQVNISNALVAEAQVNVYAKLADQILMATGSFRLSNVTSNEIKLVTSRKTAKPGDVLSVTATTRPGSYVGFLAIESGLLQGMKRDLWNILLDNVELQYDDETVSNVVAVSNLELVYGSSLRAGVRHGEMEVPYRRKLVDSWLWVTADADVEGEAVTTMTVPDSLTEWSIVAFAFGKDGLAMVPKPVTLRVKKPVVVMLNLPYSIKLNEAAVVEVYVFIEQARNMDAVVRLENPNSEFSFLNNSGRTDALRIVKYIQIKNKGMGTAQFVIQPKKLGTIKLQVAVATLDGFEDAVEQMLRVVPESLPYQRKDVRLFDLMQNVQNTTIDLVIPVLHDQGSENIVFSVSPSVVNAGKVSDLLTTAKDSDALVRTTLAALTLVAYNLDSAADADVVEASNEVVAQYQNLLHHKQDDGSFSFKADGSGSGSCLATAIAIRSLAGAKQHIFVMESVLSKAFEWLQMCQQPDGRFEEKNVPMPKLEDTIDLTAHAVLAMLELDLYREKYNGAIVKGAQFLDSSVVEEMDAYYTAKVAYVLHVAQTPTEERLFLELLNKQEMKRKSGLPWWRSNKSSQAATGYALLCFIHKGLLPESAKIMQWLAEQSRTPIAPQANTKDLVALEAMIAYQERVSSKRNQLTVTVSVPEYPEEQLQIDGHVTEKTITLPKETRSVNVLINGTGSGTFAVSYSYLSSIANMQPRFEINVEKLPSSEASYIDLTICTRFLDKFAYERTNMIVIEVTFQSGYIVLDDTLEDLKDVEHITSFRAKHDDTVLVMYMEELTQIFSCVNVTGFKRSDALFLAPGTVKVFDLYDNSRFAIEYFDK